MELDQELYVINDSIIDIDDEKENQLSNSSHSGKDYGIDDDDYTEYFEDEFYSEDEYDSNYDYELEYEVNDDDGVNEDHGEDNGGDYDDEEFERGDEILSSDYEFNHDYDEQKYFQYKKEIKQIKWEINELSKNNNNNQTFPKNLFQRNPVDTPFGHTFERKAITRYINNWGICPITKRQLTLSSLTPSKVIKGLCERFKKEQGLKYDLSSSSDSELFEDVIQLHISENENEFQNSKESQSGGEMQSKGGGESESESGSDSYNNYKRYNNFKREMSKKKRKSYLKKKYSSLQNINYSQYETQKRINIEKKNSNQKENHNNDDEITIINDDIINLDKTYENVKNDDENNDENNKNNNNDDNDNIIENEKRKEKYNDQLNKNKNIQKENKLSFLVYTLDKSNNYTVEIKLILEKLLFEIIDEKKQRVRFETENLRIQFINHLKKTQSDDDNDDINKNKEEEEKEEEDDDDDTDDDDDDDSIDDENNDKVDDNKTIKIMIMLKKKYE
ncbi:u-box domain-containing protein [Anaeramoeba flamelloides]|uniref:U-box domain-containing protein n=1 Tax=Anaeramoeba flamelloides TaxID=1746091 RepID=A0AAV7ZZM4_9EUKA|nr:u-box domain-containing protein [Anaeramoeba flamelloides]